MRLDFCPRSIIAVVLLPLFTACSAFTKLEYGSSIRHLAARQNAPQFSADPKPSCRWEQRETGLYNFRIELHLRKEEKARCLMTYAIIGKTNAELTLDAHQGSGAIIQCGTLHTPGWDPDTGLCTQQYTGIESRARFRKAMLCGVPEGISLKCVSFALEPNRLPGRKRSFKM